MLISFLLSSPFQPSRPLQTVPIHLHERYQCLPKIDDTYKSAESKSKLFDFWFVSFTTSGCRMFTVNAPYAFGCSALFGSIPLSTAAGQKVMRLRLAFIIYLPVVSDELEPPIDVSMIVAVVVAKVQRLLCRMAGFRVWWYGWWVRWQRLRVLMVDCFDDRLGLSQELQVFRYRHIIDRLLYWFTDE